jgi:hypothetical protein
MDRASRRKIRSEAAEQAKNGKKGSEAAFLPRVVGGGVTMWYHAFLLGA